MNLTPRKKNSKSRNKDKPKDKFVDKEIEEKVRQETEKKMNTDEQDKAQSIILGAEDKARSEAEMRSKEITKTMDYYHQEDEKVPIKLKENSYHENNNSPNLFMPGFSLWQDYAKMWMEFSKEAANNTTKKVFGYFENNNEKNLTTTNIGYSD